MSQTLEQGDQRNHEADRDFHYANVERIFAILMLVTACSMAFAHGSNDVANAVGPVAAVVSIINSGGQLSQYDADTTEQQDPDR